MRKRSRIAALLFFGATAGIWAQETEIHTHELADFNRALELFRERQYQSAQLLFEQLARETGRTEVKADCAYYSAHCAIRLEQPGAEGKMEDFVMTYPTSTKQNQAYIEVAHHYFEQGRYPQALEWFDRVDESGLSAAEFEKFRFQKGYAYFSAGDKKQATTYFNQVLNSPTYGSQAKYYLGFMAYETDDYTQASQYFDEVADEEKYKEKLSYFQADMQFKSGNFAKAIELGQTAMAKSNAAEKSELNKIIGESYFNLGQYDKALPFLKEYRGKKGKWSNTDFYQLGYAYYKQGDYENAIAQFNKIIGGADFVAQNAYYHLAESYLKTNRKPQALNAFKNASEMAFEPRIQEDALFNYAKLSYELGNAYQSVPDVLAGFLERYPNSPNRPEVENLLISSYITSRNYAGALALLEKNKTGNRDAYQKVTFYRGLELFTDGDYSAALDMFKKSLSEPRDAQFTARATFWKAETDYVQERFPDALLGFKQFAANASSHATPEAQNIDYNTAYAHFKLKEYDAAADFFDRYIAKNPKDRTRLNDALLRLGDSRFVSGKYWPAMEAYNKALDMKGPDADYAAFQKGISYGFVNRNDRKIEDLNKFISAFPKSQYRDDAMYELGNTYVAERQGAQALSIYDRLIADYPGGAYAARAMLRQGLVHYNAEKDNQALEKFKAVAATYPGSPEAIEAVATARLIYVDKGRVDEYAAWVRTLNFIELSDTQLDNDTYDSAEKQYMQNNPKAAISGFNSYLAQFPQGAHALKAHFYLAQLYFTDGLFDNAATQYEKVLERSRSEFTEQSLARLAEIYLKKTDVTKTIAVLKQLESEAQYPQNRTFAQANLMKTYYEQKDYPNAVVYADKVLANPKMDDKVRSDAQIIVARAAWETGDKAKARTAYAKLLTIAKGELAAEALYYDAFFKNEDGKFEASNVTVQKLAKDYSAYKYFGAKGLVVMARNFYGLKDSFQATYILENVIKNFTAYPDVVAEATAELDRIKSQESQTNSSINR